jgi:hypothetical protein
MGQVTNVDGMLTDKDQRELLEGALLQAHAALLRVPPVGARYDLGHSADHTAAALLIEVALKRVMGHYPLNSLSTVAGGPSA